jgi:hypothetical protein
MAEHELYQILRQRSRGLAWLWRAGQIGQYGGLVGALFSVAYWTGAFLVETAHSKSMLVSARAGMQALVVVSGFAVLLVCSVVLKFYAIKRAGIDLGSLGQETD